MAANRQCIEVDVYDLRPPAQAEGVRIGLQPLGGRLDVPLGCCPEVELEISVTSKDASDGLSSRVLQAAANAICSLQDPMH